MTLRHAARRNVTDDVFRQLSHEIYQGVLAPGARLPAERELARVLGVSRPALREALLRLAQAGLVAPRPGSGNHVLDFRRSAGLDSLPSLILSPEGQLDLDALRNALEMRIALGADIARLAAVRATETDAREIRRVAQAMRLAGCDLARLQELALEFWDALVKASANIAYRLAFNGLVSIYRQCYGVLTQVLADEHREAGLFEEVAAAVEAKDAEAARRLASGLLERGLVGIMGAVERVRALAPDDAGATSFFRVKIADPPAPEPPPYRVPADGAPARPSVVLAAKARGGSRARTAAKAPASTPRAKRRGGRS